MNSICLARQTYPLETQWSPIYLLYFYQSSPDEVDEEPNPFPKPYELSYLKNTFAFQQAKTERRSETYLFESYYKPLALHRLSEHLSQLIPYLDPENKRFFVVNEIISQKIKTFTELQRCLQKSAQEIFNNMLNIGCPIPDAIQDKQDLLDQALNATHEIFANAWLQGKRLREDENIREESSVLAR